MSIAFNAIFAQSTLYPLNHNPQWKASVGIREYGTRLAEGDYQQDYEIHLCLILLKAFLCREMLSISPHLLDQIILQDSKATSYEALPTLEKMLNHIGNITSGESLEFYISHDDLLHEQLHERIENLPVGRGSLYRAWIRFGNFMEDGVTALEET